MSQYKPSEFFERHCINMDYTAIQNAKAAAIDAEDVDAYDRAVAAEEEWFKQMAACF